MTGRRWSAALGAVLLGVLGVVTAGPAHACTTCNPAPAPAPSRGGHDFTGSIVVVQNGHPSSPGSAGGGSSCPGCQWRLVPLCFQRNPNDATGDDALCTGAVTYCEGRGGGIAYALYLKRDPADGWQQVDVVCIGNGNGVLPTPDLGPAVAEAFAGVDLPDAPLTVQPPGGALVNVPALFSAPTPAPQSDAVTVSLGGVTLSLTITARVEGFAWDFGDGTTRATATGGRPYAGGSQVAAEGAGDPYVSHTYRTGGTRTVSLTALWRGTWTYGGNGAQTIDELRRETTTATVGVKTARSELVS